MLTARSQLLVIAIRMLATILRRSGRLSLVFWRSAACAAASASACASASAARNCCSDRDRAIKLSRSAHVGEADHRLINIPGALDIVPSLCRSHRLLFIARRRIRRAARPPIRRDTNSHRPAVRARETRAKSAPFRFIELGQRFAGIAKRINVKARQPQMRIGRAREIRLRHLKIGLAQLRLRKLANSESS